jgi:hypothetical protein
MEAKDEPDVKRGELPLIRSFIRSLVCRGIKRMTMGMQKSDDEEKKDQK